MRKILISLLIAFIATLVMLSWTALFVYVISTYIENGVLNMLLLMFGYFVVAWIALIIQPKLTRKEDDRE